MMTDEHRQRVIEGIYMYCGMGDQGAALKIIMKDQLRSPKDPLAGVRRAIIDKWNGVMVQPRNATRNNTKTTRAPRVKETRPSDQGLFY